MLRVNKIILFNLMIISIVGLMFNSISCVRDFPSTEDLTLEAIDEVVLTPSEEVSLGVLTDEYVKPVAELETTKTNPDIIVIENKYAKISIIPNRGRLIFDYEFKPTGNSVFYKNQTPRPVKTGNIYSEEFGGYYLSIPWNPRDLQPYDLLYEVLNEGPDKAEVYIWANDPIMPVLTEVWLTVERDSSLVSLKTRITNNGEEEMNIEFNDFALIAPGGELTDNTKFAIPATAAIIEKSENDWMGAEGENITWPQSWNRWGDFKGYGLFNVIGENMLGSFFSAINPDTGDAVIKLWEPSDFFDGLRVWSLGQAYIETKGAAPTASFENYVEKISIPSSQSVDFISYFYALKGIQDVSMATPFFAGWLTTDKQFYEIDNDQFINLDLQIGSSGENEKINVVLSLSDLKGNSLNEIMSEQVSAMSPDELYSRSRKIILKETITEPGEYIFKLEILDSNDLIIFTLESPVFIAK